jgi:hypothetical protein
LGVELVAYNGEFAPFWRESHSDTPPIGGPPANLWIMSMHGLVAEDRLGRNHRQQNCLFSAIFNKKTGETRYHNPLGWRLKREFQIWLTQAFARLHAKFDHEASRASKNMQRRLKRRRRSK